jgi:predicted dehydrogenase
MVAAARKYGRMVQVGTQNRSSSLLRQAFASLRGGELGPLRFAHALVYRPRDGIGNVSGPTPVPPTVDYDLWCGPAPKGPLLRRQLHYEWHWFWATGNGELGNNGIHVIDVCRWALGHDAPPSRALSIGGRFAVNDCAQTANTQLVLLDYPSAPILCEVRNVRLPSSPGGIGKFHNLTDGVVIRCEGGYFAGNASGAALFDAQDRKIKPIADDGSYRQLETTHLSNFMAAVRSRKSADLAAEALQGHLSAAGCHMGNVSHRLGSQSAPDAIREAIRSNRELADAFERCRDYLRENGVDLAATPAILGPWVSCDPGQGRFVGDFADQANALSEREYRDPFVVPKIA